MNEPVLLLEPGPRFRVILLTRPSISQIVEREHGLEGLRLRRWTCHQDERALTGQRIFREISEPI